MAAAFYTLPETPHYEGKKKNEKRKLAKPPFFVAKRFTPLVTPTRPTSINSAPNTVFCGGVSYCVAVLNARRGKNGAWPRKGFDDV